MKITEEAYNEAAKELGVEPAVIKAVAQVEAAGDGFLDDGRVKILFERHKFHKYTGGDYDHSNPDISNPTAGGYGAGGAHQNARFSEAFALNPEAAMLSTSWGAFQIMGFNHKAAGFATVGEFVDAMKVSEDEQLKAFVNLIRTWGLGPELISRNWAEFARQYNGGNYKINKYDTKIAAAYQKFKKEAPTEPPVVVAKEEPKSDGDGQQPGHPPAPQSPKPEVTPVSAPSTSITTKIAAAASAAGPVIAATGLKIGGVEFKTGGLVAFAAVLIVGMLVAAWLWNESQKRRSEELRLSISNLASLDKENVIAAGSKV